MKTRPIVAGGTAHIRSFAARPDALLPDLTTREELALLARVLCREGYGTRLTGRLLARHDDLTFWCNPGPLSWAELRPEDLIRVDHRGHLVEGTWPGPGGLTLLLEILRRRPTVTTALIDHPTFGALWAAHGQVPPAMDQSSTAGGGDVVHLEVDVSRVDEPLVARGTVDALDGSDMALLGGAGVLVTGASVRAVHERAVGLETRCHRAWHIRAAKSSLESPLPAAYLAARRKLDGTGFYGLWEAMARRELLFDPSLVRSPGDGST